MLSCTPTVVIIRLMTALTQAYAHAFQSTSLGRRAGRLPAHDFRLLADIGPSNLLESMIKDGASSPMEEPTRLMVKQLPAGPTSPVYSLAESFLRKHTWHMLVVVNKQTTWLSSPISSKQGGSSCRWDQSHANHMYFLRLTACC